MTRNTSKYATYTNYYKEFIYIYIYKYYILIDFNYIENYMNRIIICFIYRSVTIIAETLQ